MISETSVKTRSKDVTCLSRILFDQDICGSLDNVRIWIEVTKNLLPDAPTIWNSRGKQKQNPNPNPNPNQDETQEVSLKK